MNSVGAKEWDFGRWFVFSFMWRGRKPTARARRGGVDAHIVTADVGRYEYQNSRDYR